MEVPDSKHTAFSEAIEAGDIRTAKSILSEYPSLLEHPGWTPPPLHCAVLWNQPEIAEVLLDSGADIEALDPDQRTTPLRYAIVFNKLAMVRLLLERGANSGPIVENGTTALQLAKDAAAGEFEEHEDLPARGGYTAVVEFLAGLGLD